MLVTILLLIFTVIVLPILTVYFGTPLTQEQWDILIGNSDQIGVIYLVIGVIAYCFIVGELSGNNSQVDKLWSIVPILYAWYMTYLADFPTRMTFMSVLVTIWGVRLTLNFARRGAYTWKFWAGEEDYRWEELRKRPGFNNRFVWMLFNLFFICGYQNTLIFLFTLPVLACHGAGVQTDLTWIDYLLALLFVGFVVIEFIADQQQYDFQTEKYRRIHSNLPLEEYSKGFVDSGLWKLVRHPNYAAEQSIWIVYFLFTVVATGEWLNWSIAGCLLLVILFKGSSDFSEEISARKYPAYKDYQSKTPRFIPFLKG
jgi:steroid 5-alpha reductase family enzyme